MAEHVVLESVYLHRIPDSLTAEAGAWTEPVAVAVRGVRRGNVEIGDRVAILGAGPIGQVTLQVARAAGAGEAVVVETSEFRGGVARACGASEVLTPGDVPDLDRRFDVVFDCTGAPAALDTAADLVEHGGRVVVIGTYTDAPTLSTPMIPHFKEATITFSICYQEHDFARALDLLARGFVDVAPLTTRIDPLDVFAAAFSDMGNPEHTLKVLLSPTSAA
jgi:2-desacetyl-2-hydroxyethyl bacteriochlorophyllide A dehydrogenase